MSRTGDFTWVLSVPRAGTGPTPLRIAVRGHQSVAVQVGGSRALMFDVRLLAELVEDLRAAGRMLRALEAGAYLAREYGGPPSGWAPVLTDDEIAELDTDEGGEDPP